MKKVILIVVALLIVTVVVWRYANRSGKAPAAATLLPDTTVLFLDVPDFRKSQKQFERTQAYALWQEPEVQAFLEKPRAALRDLVGAGKNDSAATAFLQDRALNLPQGEVFLAITHVSPPPLVQIGRAHV